MFKLITFVCLASLNVFVFISKAHAADGDTLSGPAVIEESGSIWLDGWKITLWGMDMLAPDQMCWRDGVAWGCGEQAITALNHYISGRSLRCAIKELFEKEKAATAQCFFDYGGKTHDVAAYMISQGLAIDNPDQSKNLYDSLELQARERRRGIWTSRFQTAEDWKEGINRYVEYAIEPEPTPTTDAEDSAVTTYEYDLSFPDTATPATTENPISSQSPAK